MNFSIDTVQVGTTTYNLRDNSVDSSDELVIEGVQNDVLIITTKTLAKHVTEE